jgi:hypothetical protein
MQSEWVGGFGAGQAKRNGDEVYTVFTVRRR